MHEPSPSEISDAETVTLWPEARHGYEKRIAKLDKLARRREQRQAKPEPEVRAGRAEQRREGAR